jgi:hypothetical protein
MTRYYSSWHINPALIPTNPEERMKLWHTLLERVKAEMKTGALTEWGISPSFNGYSIRDGDEKGIMAATSSWAPFILVDSLEPVLTPDEALDSVKRLETKK